MKYHHAKAISPGVITDMNMIVSMIANLTVATVYVIEEGLIRERIDHSRSSRDQLQRIY